MRYNIKPQFTATTRQGRATIILPSDMHTCDLIEITAITDMYAKFIHTSTGEVIDCSVYAEMLTRTSSDCL